MKTEGHFPTHDWRHITLQQKRDDWQSTEYSKFAVLTKCCFRAVRESTDLSEKDFCENDFRESFSKV